MEKKWREIVAALSELRESGIVDAATARRIEAYAEVKSDGKVPKSWGMYFLGSLGALLIGTGIITLLASNWAWIPRWAQTVIAFIPLVLTGSFAVWSRGKEWGRRLEVLEVLGIFWAAAVFEAVALVARIYQLPSDGAAFLCTSLVLLIPVAYATRGTGVLLAYLIASLVGGGIYVDYGSFHWQSIGFLFGFPLLIAPLLRQKAGVFIKEPPSVSQLIWRWLLVLWLSAAMIILSIVVGSSCSGGEAITWSLALLFTSLYLAGGVFRPDGENRLSHRPLEIIGLGGSVITSYVAFEAAASCELSTGFLVLMMLPLIPLFVLGVLLSRMPKRRYMIAIALAVPLVFIFSCFTEPGYRYSEIRFLFWARAWGIAGIGFLLTGLSAGRRLRANVGLLVVIACGVAHLFAWDISLTFKGMAFIATGLAFFVLNFFFNRMKGGAQ